MRSFCRGSGFGEMTQPRDPAVLASLQAESTRPTGVTRCCPSLHCPGLTATWASTTGAGRRQITVCAGLAGCTAMGSKSLVTWIIMQLQCRGGACLPHQIKHVRMFPDGGSGKGSGNGKQEPCSFVLPFFPPPSLPLCLVHRFPEAG